MTLFSRLLAAAAAASLALLAPASPAFAGGQSYGGGHGNYGSSRVCPGGGSSVSITHNISIYKPVTITHNISIYKPITIIKNIDLSKHIDISKTIIINNGGRNSAAALAAAIAFANARASANVVVYGGSGYYEEPTRSPSEIGGGEIETPCTPQWATLIKAVHAICVDRSGREHPATRMVPDTWIDSSLSGEIFRCLEGSVLRVAIGDVVQSDQGMAGIYEGARTLECNPGEALRHFQDGLVKCAAAEPVPDCTERTNLRRYGAGDVFFSYLSQVCARPSEASAAMSSPTGEVNLSGMGLDGGVGYAQ